MVESKKRSFLAMEESAAAAGPSPPPTRFEFYTGANRGSSGGRGVGGYTPAESFASPIRNPSPRFYPSSDQHYADPRNYHMVTPTQHFQMNQSLNQNPYEMSLHIPQRGQWTPVPFASPFPVPGANPATTPGVSNRSGGSSGQFHPSSSRGGHTSPRFGRGRGPFNNSGRGSLHSGGRGGHSINNSGRGRPFNNSGRGSPHSGSSHKESYQFCIKSVVEDPWHELEPIVGSILVPLASPGSWLPKSLTAKKTKSEESGNKISTQWSLAESLAASFEAALNEANA